MKMLNKAPPPSLVVKNIFTKNKQRYIHKGDNDDADNNDNNDSTSPLHIPLHRLER